LEAAEKLSPRKTRGERKPAKHYSPPPIKESPKKPAPPKVEKRASPKKPARVVEKVVEVPERLPKRQPKPNMKYIESMIPTPASRSERSVRPVKEQKQKVVPQRKIVPVVEERKPFRGPSYLQSSFGFGLGEDENIHEPAVSERRGRGRPPKSSSPAVSVQVATSSKLSAKTFSKIENKHKAAKVETKPPVKVRPAKTSNPFGFGDVEEPVPEIVAPARAEKQFVKKRDAKVERKIKTPPKPASRLPQAKPVGRPQKFQKKDRSGGLGLGLSPSPVKKAAAPVEKKLSKGFFGLFGGENPFMKPSKVSKSLIATPSKFEIRSHASR
jgi:hypothetical protein